jgi:hypothetical protein
VRLRQEDDEKEKVSRPAPKTVRIQDHPDYDQYAKIVRAYHQEKAKEIGISYEEYTYRLNLGFEDD